MYRKCLKRGEEKEREIDYHWLLMIKRPEKGKRLISEVYRKAHKYRNVNRKKWFQ